MKSHLIILTMAAMMTPVVALAATSTQVLAAAQTQNEQAVARYIYQTGGNEMVNEILDLVETNSEIRDFLNQLSGATYANQTYMLAKIGQYFENELADRLDAYTSCHANVDRYHIKEDNTSCKNELWWFAVYGGRQNLLETTVSNLRADTYGLAIGAEIPAFYDIVLGVGFSYNDFRETATEIENASAKGQLYQFGVYSRKEWDGLRVGASMDYGVTNNVHAERMGSIIARNLTLTGGYQASVFSAQARASYETSIESDIDGRPIVGVIYQHVQRESFSETPYTGFTLNEAAAQYSSLRSQLGGYIEIVPLFNSYPFLLFTWEHEFSDQKGVGFASLDGIPETFRAIGTNVARDALVIKAGTIIAYKNSWDLSIQYEGRFAGSFNSNGARIEMSYF